ncbi:MAG: dihydroxyacetone kinase subunit L [Promethearchaeota archaeon]|nr:MAG: dihydroxyacetone kinase subunit L [Candidatus Lokiarchaeota archaeon]
MTKDQLTIKDTVEMFLFVAKRVIDSKDILTEADKKIGDGDHGVNMARGFQTVIKILEEDSFPTLGDLLNSIGMSLLTSVGGAAGAIFGTFFRGGAKNLMEESVFNAQTLSIMLIDALEAIQQRGKAKKGDKTMVDVLEPAALKSKETRSLSLKDALSLIVKEAEEGVEKTKEMVATVGKAKTLGERSLGYSDPGAITTSLILRYMLEYVKLE